MPLLSEGGASGGWATPWSDPWGPALCGGPLPGRAGSSPSITFPGTGQSAGRLCGARRVLLLAGSAFFPGEVCARKSRMYGQHSSYKQSDCALWESYLAKTGERLPWLPAPPSLHPGGLSTWSWADRHPADVWLQRRPHLAPLFWPGPRCCVRESVPLGSYPQGPLPHGVVCVGRDLDWDGEHPSTPPRAASETPQWTDPLGLQKTRFGNCQTLPGPPQRACFWLRSAARSRRWGEPGQAWPPHGSRSNRRAACGADTQPLSRRLSEAAQQLGCFPGGGTGWLAGSGPR